MIAVSIAVTLAQVGTKLLREERKAFFQYRPGLLGNRREGNKLESNAHERSYYLRPGLVSVSDALVLRITVISEKQMEVNPRKSDAGLLVLLHHYLVIWKSKRRTN